MVCIISLKRRRLHSKHLKELLMGNMGIRGVNPDAYGDTYFLETFIYILLYRFNLSFPFLNQKYKCSFNVLWFWIQSNYNACCCVDIIERDAAKWFSSSIFLACNTGDQKGKPFTHIFISLPIQLRYFPYLWRWLNFTRKSHYFASINEDTSKGMDEISQQPSVHQNTT